MLATLVALLAASVLFVPLSRRLGLGSVLGYLVAGVVIGGSGLHLVSDVEQITEVSELGVVMLLFIIGLELRPERLWVMRKTVFGLGTAQVALAGTALGGAAYLAGWGGASATVIGAGLALSSTAIVLPMLSEYELLGTTVGRQTFGVLLFQDLAFIPLIAGIPLLTRSNVPTQLPWMQVFHGVVAIAGILVAGRFVVPQIFRLIGGARTPEVFTATALLIVVGTAYTAHLAGLSMSLGAFLAGVLLSSSEYRHELKADIEPFEGLLLGFFFMSVGMGTDLGQLWQHPLEVIAGVVFLLAVKGLVGFLLARLWGQNAAAATRFALALPQGSEFSFVLFTAAVGAGALLPEQASRASLVIALSMAATPLLFALSERSLIPVLARPKDPDYDLIVGEKAPVIICGFGRVGQIVGRVLRLQGIPFTAFEQDSAQVDVVRRFGTKVYYGDPTRADLLRSAGAESAALIVIALNDVDHTLRVVDMVRRHFPNLPIVVRARNRRHVHLLMDRGVRASAAVRETFHSSLRLSELVLTQLNVPEALAKRTVRLFAEMDERTLLETHSFYQDERQLIQTQQDAANELQQVFEADRQRAAEVNTAPPSADLPDS